MKRVPLPSGSPSDDTTTFVVSLHDRSGALERVIGVARRQGCAVIGLTLVPSDRTDIAQLSLTVRGGSPLRLAQQLGRLVDVVAVRDAQAAPSWRNRTRSDAQTEDYHIQADGMPDLPGTDRAPNEHTT